MRGGGNGSVRVAEPRTELAADAAAALDEPELVALARQGAAGAFREIMRRKVLLQTTGQAAMG